MGDSSRSRAAAAHLEAPRPTGRRPEEGHAEPHPFACSLGALLLAAGACAAVIGINEDNPKYADDGGVAFYGQATDAGFKQNVVSILWQPDDPLSEETKNRVRNAIESAHAKGVNVILALYPGKARAITDGGLEGGADFLQQVVSEFPQVTSYIVGNEPNQPRFWQPQFNADRSQASGAAFEAFLARSYDVLKQFSPGVKVIGVGLSPRGNDRPLAKSNISTSPVRFLKAMGDAYRKSGRTKPIMDSFSFHPYPNRNTDTPAKGYPWPNGGVVNLDRIKQAIWDAFNGTGQPTIEDGLTIDLDEVGWQVDTANQSGYTGRENVPTVSEAQQAAYHADIVRRVACDSTVSSLNFFHFVDETDRDRFQSGAIRADGTKRASFDMVSKAIADTNSGTTCKGKRVAWQHTTTIVGGGIAFGKLAAQPTTTKSFTIAATAREGGSYKAGLFRVTGPLDPNGKTRIAQALPRAPVRVPRPRPPACCSRTAGGRSRSARRRASRPASTSTAC